MTLIGGSLAAATVAAAAAVVTAIALPARPRRVATGLLTAAAGGAGMVASVATLVAGERFGASLPDLLPFAGVRLCRAHPLVA